MRIVVVGAAGRVGQQVVAQALAAHHPTLAYLREPARLELAHPWLEKIEGDATDVARLARAMRGRDAVISTLGGKRVAGPRSFVTDGTQGVLRAMQKAGLRRLIAIGSKGLTPGPSPDLLLGDVDMPVALRFAFADHRAAFGLIRASGLDWTVLCPPHLIDGPCTGRYLITVDAFAPRYGAIHTGDVAHAALLALARPDWIGHTVGVAGLEPAA
jgi:putative NADH-flavin reductase